MADSYSAKVCATRSMGTVKYRLIAQLTVSEH